MVISVKLLRRTRAALGAQPAPAAPARREERRPLLTLLVSDAARRSGYRTHTFPDAASAIAFIEFWFPPSLRHGLIAFWAPAGEPEPTENPHDGDVVILVRDRRDPTLVSPFSFADQGSALAFLRGEMARGLDPRRVLVHFATPVRIQTSPSGHVLLDPARPPSARCAAAAGPALEPPPAPQRPAEEPPRQVVAATLPQEVRSPLAEVRRVLQVRRWEARQDAFQGFGSPPGRF